MSRRKTKKPKQQIIKHESNNLSKEQMIEIQAEAYYRVLKRIEDEKTKDDKQKPEKRKYKWYEEILFSLNIFLWPWKINKRFSVSNRIYDSIPVLFVSGVLRFIGGLMWLIGLTGFGLQKYILVICRVTNDILIIIAISFAMLAFGSIFILAGGEFEKETDSNKIYCIFCKYYSIGKLYCKYNCLAENVENTQVNRRENVFFMEMRMNYGKQTKR